MKYWSMFHFLREPNIEICNLVGLQVSMVNSEKKNEDYWCIQESYCWTLMGETPILQIKEQSYATSLKIGRVQSKTWSRKDVRNLLCDQHFNFVERFHLARVGNQVIIIPLLCDGEVGIKSMTCVALLDISSHGYTCYVVCTHFHTHFPTFNTYIGWCGTIT